MGAIVNAAIGFMIAFLPLYTKVGVGDLSRLSKDNLLFSFFIGACFFLPERARRLPITLYAAFIYGLLTLAVHHWNSASVYVMLQMFYISAGIFFFASFYEKHDTKTTDYILNGMTIGCVIQSLIVIVSAQGFRIYFYIMGMINDGIVGVDINTLGIGSLGNPNLLAAYVALTALSLVRGNLILLLPLPLVALFYTDSVMGIATLLAGLFYLLNLNKKIIKKIYLYGITTSLMVLFYFTGVNGYDTKRFKLWDKIFSMVDIKSFLIGNGPGWFPTLGITVSSGDIALQEHNEFISAFNIFGILIFVLIAPTFIKFLKRSDDNKIMSSILFAGFCNSYGHFTLHQSSTALIIIVAAAICLAERKNNVSNLEW